MSNPAETYERFMVPVLFAPWASRLVQSANSQAGERILDVACGTGVVARRVAAHLGSTATVAGLDLNPDMLAVARTMAESEGHAIEWHEGRAESMPFQTASFDVLLCQQALQFFADRQAAVAEMYRVLADGGRVVLSVWQGLHRHPFYQTLHDVIRKRLGMSGVAEIFALGDDNQLRVLLTDAGFDHVEITPLSMTAHFPDPAGFLAGEIDVDTAAIPSMQHLDARTRQAMTAAIRDDMDAALQGVTEDDHVVLPFHANIVRARRPSA